MTKIVSIEELFKHTNALGENEIVLDVRSADEFAEGHIKGALNISHDEVDEHIEQLKKYDKIYIHCKMGGRAKRAFDTLEDEGLGNAVVCIEAGFEAWKENGYPVDK